MSSSISGRIRSRRRRDRPGRFAVPLILVLLAVAGVGCTDNRPLVVPGPPALRVPEDFPYPQAAVDSASSGMVVLVKPGVYTHTEVRDVDPDGFPGGIRAALFMKDGVAVTGTGDAGTSVLRDTVAADSTFGLVFVSVGNATKVENIAVESFGTGALIRGQGGYIENCRMSGDPVGIRVLQASDPLVIGNLVEDAADAGIRSERDDGGYGANFVRRCGVGIDVLGPGSPYLQANVLCSDRIGLRGSSSATPILRANVIRNNASVGVLLTDGTRPDFTQNDLYENGIDLQVADYAPPLDTLYAEGNYWSSTDVADIGLNRIRDASDDPAAGAVVDFLPVSPISFFPLNVNLGALCGPTGSGAPEEILAVLAELSRTLPGGH